MRSWVWGEEGGDSRCGGVAGDLLVWCAVVEWYFCGPDVVSTIGGKGTGTVGGVDGV